MRNLFLMLMLIFVVYNSKSQNNFNFEKEGETKDKVNFNLVGNFTIVPMTVNGVELSFLLDTGVDKTIIFSLENIDSLDLNNAHAITFAGYGGGEPIKGFKSEDNRVEIGKAVSNDFTLFVIFDKENNFSPRLGIPVHGIIGYDFYKNFVVEINYDREFIKFFEPEHYDEKCRRCGKVELTFHDHKPYLKTQMKVAGVRSQVNLLIDTGLGDALWLFCGPEITLPKPNFDDFLGLGFSGSVYGKRSKIDAFFLGEYEFNAITTAFPDSSSTYLIDFKLRKNGLVGAEILKRFNLVFDYQGQQMWFHPNHFFDDPFLYNMSGLVLEYDGFQIVKDYDRVFLNPLRDGSQQKDLRRKNSMVSFEVKFNLKPKLKIVEVRSKSPAEIAGLKEGDVVLRVNGKETHHYSLVELASLFSSEEGKRIKMKVFREGVGVLKKKFHLKKVL